MHTINEICSQISFQLGHTMIRVVLIGYDTVRPIASNIHQMALGRLLSRNCTSKF